MASDKDDQDTAPKKAAPKKAAPKKAAPAAPPYCETCEAPPAPDPHGKHVCARCRREKVRK